MIFNFGIIVQARIKSNRLPSKILLPFYNKKTILDIIIERLQSFIKKYKIKIPIILATSENKADSILVEFAKKYKIDCFRGDENNVLKRYVDCCNKYNIDHIIRICADNPFLSMKYLKILLSFVEKSLSSNRSKYDYVSFTLDNITPSIKEHIGIFAEYTTLPVLKSVLYSTTNKFYLEHVTNYLYTYPENYNLHLINFDYKLSNTHIDLKSIRLTLDTIDDFVILQDIYKSYLKNNCDLDINIKDVIKLLESNHYKVMKQQIEKNNK
jgi:spore coat polysaccharide biosynthesis protein SpsF